MNANNNIDNHNRRPPLLSLTTRGERVVTAVVGLALAGAAVAGVEVFKPESGLHPSLKQRVEALESNNQAEPQVFLLKSGATYRSTPEMTHDAPDAGFDNTLGQVPKGQKWVVTFALSKNSASPTGWVGFTVPSTHTKAPHSVEERAEETVYVNETELLKEGKAEVLTQYRGDPGAISVDADGTLAWAKGGPDSRIASAHSYAANATIPESVVNPYAS